MARLGELLERRSREGVFGREREVERLVSFVHGDEPVVKHVQGIAGVGKTQLLDALAARLAEDRDVALVRLDARTCEPSPASFARALGVPPSPSGAEVHDAATVAAHLSDRAPRVVLAVDSYEAFRLLDAWIRRELLPLLGDNVRTLLVSREPPSPAFRTSPSWTGLFSSMILEPFAEPVALDYLLARGLSASAARELNAVAAGHPLALALGVALAHSGAPMRAASTTRHQVIDHLASLFLEDVADPSTRRIAQAACIVRTVTAPLLAAMLPDVPAHEAMERLRALPFVSAGPDGLEIHEVVRAALATALKAEDPHRHRAHRRAACAVARDEYRRATREERWRCTADVLYLLENEALRAGFFPREPAPVAVEAARAEDRAAVRAIAARHDGPQATAIVDLWWRHHPGSFFVVRAPDGGVVGYYNILVPAKVHRTIPERDPLAAQWARDLPRSEDRAAALWVRRTLDHEVGEGLSPAQAACWIDIKRAYMELRPRLRWVYTSGRDRELHRTALERLGFRELEGDAPTLDGAPLFTFRLDMGQESVDGWLGRLLSEEVGDGARQMPAAPSSLLDDEAREVVVEGERVALTPLELGVLSYLAGRPGKAVARHELISAVWGYGKDAATSNVVETVVRSLRQKLGSQREALETVRGVGYRYRPPSTETKSAPRR